MSGTVGTDGKPWPGNRFKKHHTDKLRRQLILGTTVAVGVGLYAMHHKRVNTLLNMHKEATYETMWSSFDEGVKYGLELAKQGGQYAFGAFDRPAA